jgi:hypothetical protein
MPTQINKIKNTNSHSSKWHVSFFSFLFFFLLNESKKYNPPFHHPLHFTYLVQSKNGENGERRLSILVYNATNQTQVLLLPVYGKKTQREW